MLRGHVIDASDWALITGYEDTGDILLGMSPYGGRDRFRGHDVILDWHERTQGYIILGDRCERPAAVDVYREALRLAVDLVRTPRIGDHYAGLKAYEVLASALRDEECPEKTEREEDELWFRYLCLLCYNMMLDDHASAPPFLRDAAGALPAGADELQQAAECYEASHELRHQLEGILPSDFSQDAQRLLTNPTVRDEYAATLLQIRESDAEAISHVERALAGASHD